MATLIVTEGPASGEQFALGDHRLMMIGRDNECTFQIVDPQMSRRHMQIQRDGDAHVAIDFASANGVYVNGERIEEQVALADGDQIRIGGTTILYTTEDSPDAKTIDGLLHKRGEGLRSTMVRKVDRE